MASKKTDHIDIEPASARNTLANTNKKRQNQSKKWVCLHFKDKKLEKMYKTKEGTKKYSQAVVENFFRKILLIQKAKSKQDLYIFRSLGFHQLKKGKLKGQYAVWLTGNWRLTMKFKEDKTSAYLVILAIVDYHH